MKLCSLTQSYAERGGGVRTYLHAQRAYAAQRADLEYVLIVPGAADGTTRTGRSATLTVRSPLLPGSDQYRLLLRSRRVLRILREERPDVIEVHCPYNLPWTAFHYRRSASCAVVGMYHTDVARTYVEALLRPRLGAAIATTGRRLGECYTRSLYRRCDLVVATSPAMHARLAALGIAAQLVPLGVDLATFRPERRDPALRARFGAGPDTLVLVYAGRLDAEKRPDLLISMLGRLPASFAVRLLLVGDGPLRPALERRAAVDGRVHVLPYVSDRGQLAALLASADVYVSAMAHETFGLAVLEAQAAGLPVLGLRAGAMLDRVPPGTGILVDAAAPDDLGGVLVATPAAAWRRMGSAARAHVQASYSWNRTFETLTGLYADRR